MLRKSKDISIRQQTIKTMGIQSKQNYRVCGKIIQEQTMRYYNYTEYPRRLLKPLHGSERRR